MATAGYSRIRIENTAAPTTDFVMAEATYPTSVVAGQSFVVTVTMTRAGVGLVNPVDGVNVAFKRPSDNARTAANRSGDWNTTTPSTYTIYFNNSSLLGGNARSGLWEIAVGLDNTGGLPSDYYATSDGSQNFSTTTQAQILPAGYQVQRTRGFIRGSTTVTTSLPLDSYAYGEGIMSTFTLGAEPIDANGFTANASLHTVSVNFSATGSSATTITPVFGNMDNRWVGAAGTSRSLVLNSGATVSLPATPHAAADSTAVGTLIIDSQNSDTAVLDPRLTFVAHHQKNDNVYATPPQHDGTQRLTSDLSFLAFRIINAKGAGQNSITVDSRLWDAGGLIGTEASPVKIKRFVTATKGGETGWSGSLVAGPAGYQAAAPDGFVTWDNALPGGSWLFKHIIQASGSPANTTGLEQNNTHTYSLVAADPNLSLIAAGGPGTVATDTRHFVPGGPFVAGVALFHAGENRLVDADPSSAKIAVARFNLATKQTEVLQADRSTWLPGQVDGNLYYFSAVEYAVGSKVYVVEFTGAETSSWSPSDIFTIGKAEIGGVPLSNFAKEIVTSGKNNHDGYVFDGPGFVGFPTR